MQRLRMLIGAALLNGALSACAFAQDDLSAIPPQSGAAFSPAYAGLAPEVQAGPAKPPSGYVAFCERNPDECRTPRDAGSKEAFNDTSWAMLEDVNYSVNKSISPIDDIVHYGVTEYWTVPVDGYGDCEDYVLAKRKMLMLLGVPESALRITVAFTRGGVRHAVLTVITDHGEYVLDNMQDDIVAADKTDYKWVERQDPASHTGWVALN